MRVCEGCERVHPLDGYVSCSLSHVSVPGGAQRRRGRFVTMPHKSNSKTAEKWAQRMSSSFAKALDSGCSLARSLAHSLARTHSLPTISPLFFHPSFLRRSSMPTASVSRTQTTMTMMHCPARLRRKQVVQRHQRLIPAVRPSRPVTRVEKDQLRMMILISTICFQRFKRKRNKTMDVAKCHRLPRPRKGNKSGQPKSARRFCSRFRSSS